MSDDTAIFVGASDADQFLLLKYANRHGLIAGATGTGKTVTLQTIAEGFSAYGVPVFMADVKGDLSGVSQPGADNPHAIERAQQLKIDGYKGRAFPTIYWDLFGDKGHPVRTTVTEIGPVLMARLLQLNDTQEGVLEHRLQGRRRAGPAAARFQGPAERAAMDGGECRHAHHQVRQCQQAEHRHHPARAA